MNRSDFTGLPLSVALGIIWDGMRQEGFGEFLESLPVPERARPPKYDCAIYRKDGVTWASEYDAAGLAFWQAKKQESADGGGQWAEKDAKAAKALGFWLAWRAQNPDAVWSGERNHEQVRAKPPAAKPTVYPRTSKPTPLLKEDNDDDDELPF